MSDRRAQRPVPGVLPDPAARLLAVWGKHDTYFLPAGAEAFRRDNPSAIVHLLDTGHFGREAHVEEVALLMRQFVSSRQ
jgi:pimeloyl-ACP methyl ester carboxylesterase